MNENEKKRLKEASARFFAEKDKAFYDAIKSGSDVKTAMEAAKTAHQNAHPGRGGFRPGAGRKPGGLGRRDSARLEFNVSDDFKARFEAAAQSRGLTKVEFLKRLFDEKMV